MAESGMKPRVVIVGAGPAGVRCAQTLVEAGLRPTVVDEGRRDGGQIYRRQPENFKRPYGELYGTEAGKARDLHQTFASLKDEIDYRPETLIWNVAGDQCYTVTGNRHGQLRFDAIVLATGATDRLMPIKGWNLAGTFSLGGSQVALKSQACSIGERVVFMGTGPLLYLVASQYLKAGANVAAVLDTSAQTAQLRALPKLMAQPGVLWKGMLLTVSLLRARVPLYKGIEPLKVEGEPDTGVSGVLFKDARGKQQGIACDAVAMGYHLRPETQLADLTRCHFEFDPRTRQWLPERDRDGRASVHGVYLAGDGVQILGADAAETSGRLVALAVLQDFGLKADEQRMQNLRDRLQMFQRFAQGLAEAFPWPAAQAKRLSDDTIVCRCECITAGELREAIDINEAREANRAKAFSRVGMGRCQGRYCGNAGAEVIAAHAGIPIEEAGRLRGQGPVKPLPIDLVPESVFPDQDVRGNTAQREPDSADLQ